MKSKIRNHKTRRMKVLHYAAVFSALLLFYAVFPSIGLAEDVHTHNDIDFTVLDSSYTGGSLTSGNYYLSNDVVLTEPMVIEKDAVVNLCLNGHLLSLNQNWNYTTIAVGGTLSVYDCCEGKESARHYLKASGYSRLLPTSSVTEDYIDGGAIVGSGRCVYAGPNPDSVKSNPWGHGGSGSETAVFTLYSGALLGGDVHLFGGGLLLGENATANMYGGKIIGCQAASTEGYGDDCGGGGVMAYGKGSVFNMYGGVITRNTAYHTGGGVSNYKGATVNIYDGEISYNRCNFYGGAGIFAYDTGKVYVHGGKIINNQATNSSVGAGGAVLVDGYFFMDGGTISGNYAASHGGALKVSSGNSSGTPQNVNATVIGGTITNNTCYKNNVGGGISVDGGKLYIGGTAEVSGNYCANGTVLSDVYLPSKVVLYVAEPGKGGKIGVLTKDKSDMSHYIDIENVGVPTGVNDFFSDDPKYIVRVGDDSILELGYPVVKFELNGHGQAIPSQTVVGGERAAKPEDPTDPDLEFLGWYEDQECTVLWDFNTPVTKDITLYAKWPSPIPPVPKTGDSSMLLLYATAGVFSLILIFLMKKKRVR